MPQRDPARNSLAMLRDALPEGSTVEVTGERNLIAGDEWATWKITATVPISDGVTVRVLAHGDTIGVAISEVEQMLLTAGVALNYPGMES